MVKTHDLSVLLLCVAGISESFGAGFQLGQQSVVSMGRSLGGGGVAGDDLADIFFNAAGITLYDEGQVQVGAVVLRTDNGFHDKGSFQSIGGFKFPSSGPEDSIEETAITPSLYYVLPSLGELRFGIAIAPTFGQSTNYDRDWIGRYHAVESDLRIVDVNPIVGYRVNNQLSVGMGVVYQMIDATLSQAVFTGPFSPDGFAEVKGDDRSWGVNAGIMYEFEPGQSALAGTRIGMSFRSGVKHTLSGRRKLSGTGPTDGSVGATARLQLPETVYLSLWHPVNDDLNVSLTARWTNWSRNDEIRIQFADGSPDNVTPQHWDDSWYLGIAADYRLDDRWAIRGGLGFDQTPIPGRRLRTPRNPDADTLWVSLGASYKFDKSNFLDVAYVAWRMDSASLSTTVDLNPYAPGTVTDTLVGEYDSTVIHALGLQYRHVFN